MCQSTFGHGSHTIPQENLFMIAGCESYSFCMYLKKTRTFYVYAHLVTVVSSSLDYQFLCCHDCRIMVVLEQIGTIGRGFKSHR